MRPMPLMITSGSSVLMAIFFFAVAFTLSEYNCNIGDEIFYYEMFYLFAIGKEETTS